MRQIKVIDTYDKMLGLKPAWDELLAASDMDMPFMTFEWFSFWWGFQGQGRAMMIITVYDDGKLIAIAPLMKSKTTWRFFPVRAISLMVDYYSGRAGFIVAREKTDAVASVIEYLKGGNYSFDMLDFDFLPAESTAGKFLANALNGAGLKYVLKPRINSPYIQTTGTWEEYLCGRSQNFRHKLSKTLNKFRKVPSYEIAKYTKNALDVALRQIDEISSHSWKFAEKSSIVNSDEKSRFFKELTASLAALGWLNIWILKINNTPAAFAYNVKYKNRVYAMEIGYCEEYANLSPSEFLNTEAIKECFDGEIEEYDWLGDALAFKMKWTHLTREHNRYWIFNDSLYGKFLCLMETLCVKPLMNLKSGVRGLPAYPKDITS